eukprot:Gregarina_sp_Poly_1__4117@NODE_2258_length_2394_cov_64_655780_g1448_i1_p2_GENE_NODE_2258_length_2394_cov_64_655780_g1448_i1NODE_2258_length_2394_cov_64_655780_g1448_i1_p2_ORF_typecomplete_len126_score14_19_NODE_2258_length_2394_cov_64_655780_g1448_i119182295
MCTYSCYVYVCITGRKYPITLKKTELISTIWDEMIKQNPQIKEKNLVPFMYLGREPLELEKRLINYDFEDGSKVFVIFPPQLCFIRDFRKPPKKKPEPEMETQPTELERKAQKSMDGSKDDASTV